MRNLVAAMLGLVLALMPSIVMACPACFAASSERTLRAYYLSTMLLTVMPFVLIGGVIFAVFLIGRRPDSVSGKPPAE
jgi:hypothetical protein